MSPKSFRGYHITHISIELYRF